MDGELEKVLELARERFEQFDLIIDLFDGTVTWINEDTSMFMGQSSSDMIGTRPFSASFKDSEDGRNKCMEFMKGGKFEMPIPTNTGEMKTVHFECNTIDMDEHPYLVIKALEKPKEI